MELCDCFFIHAHPTNDLSNHIHPPLPLKKVKVTVPMLVSADVNEYKNLMKPREEGSPMGDLNKRQSLPAGADGNLLSPFHQKKKQWKPHPVPKRGAMGNAPQRTDDTNNELTNRWGTSNEVSDQPFTASPSSSKGKVKASNTKVDDLSLTPASSNGEDLQAKKKNWNTSAGKPHEQVCPAPFRTPQPQRLSASSRWKPVIPVPDLDGWDSHDVEALVTPSRRKQEVQWPPVKVEEAPTSSKDQSDPIPRHSDRGCWPPEASPPPKRNSTEQIPRHSFGSSRVVQWPPLPSMDLTSKSKERALEIAPQVPVSTRRTEFERSEIDEPYELEVRTRKVEKPGSELRKDVLEKPQGSLETNGCEKQRHIPQNDVDQVGFESELNDVEGNKESFFEADVSDLGDDDDYSRLEDHMTEIGEYDLEGEEEAFGKKRRDESNSDLDESGYGCSDSQELQMGTSIDTFDESTIDTRSLLRPPEKRTSYRIRYSGPRVSRSDDRFAPTGEAPDGAPNQPTRSRDSAPSRPARPSSFDDTDDDFHEEKRPDVWITPMHDISAENAMWKVRRVWADETADEEEEDHNVSRSNLFGKIKTLIGAPESPPPKDGLPKLPARDWHVRKILESDGELNENEPEEDIHEEEMEGRMDVMTDEAIKEKEENEKALKEYEEMQKKMEEKAARRARLKGRALNPAIQIGKEILLHKEKEKTASSTGLESVEPVETDVVIMKCADHDFESTPSIEKPTGDDSEKLEDPLKKESFDNNILVGADHLEEQGDTLNADITFKNQLTLETLSLHDPGDESNLDGTAACENESSLEDPLDSNISDEILKQNNQNTSQSPQSNDNASKEDSNEVLPQGPQSEIKLDTEESENHPKEEIVVVQEELEAEKLIDENKVASDGTPKVKKPKSKKKHDETPTTPRSRNNRSRSKEKSDSPVPNTPKTPKKSPKKVVKEADCSEGVNKKIEPEQKELVPSRKERPVAKKMISLKLIVPDSSSDEDSDSSSSPAKSPTKSPAEKGSQVAAHEAKLWWKDAKGNDEKKPAIAEKKKIKKISRRSTTAPK